MTNEMVKHLYTYYGLSIQSDFAFPELLPGSFENPDIIISLGKLKEKYVLSYIPEGLHFVSADCFVFRTEENLIYQVSDGQSIVVQLPENKEIDFDQLRLYLLSPVFNALLHQRRMVLFHASVICKESQCLAIAGATGFGKSTIAAELCLKRDYYFLADDVCAIAPDDTSSYRILPSSPRLKILPDAMKRLNLDCGIFHRISENTGKLAVPVRDRLQGADARLAAFFILAPNVNNVIGIIELKGMEKIESMLKSTFWVDYLRWMGHQDYLFRECNSISQKVDVYLLKFDKSLHSPGTIADTIEDVLKKKNNRSNWLLTHEALDNREL